MDDTSRQLLMTDENSDDEPRPIDVKFPRPETRQSMALSTAKFGLSLGLAFVLVFVLMSLLSLLFGTQKEFLDLLFAGLLTNSTLAILVGLPVVFAQGFLLGFFAAMFYNRLSLRAVGLG